MSTPIDISVKIFIVALLVSEPSHASLHSYFKNFDEISEQNISLRSKRDSRGADAHVLKFHALGRHFKITLYTGAPVLSDDFAVHLIHSDFETEHLPMDYKDHFVGFANEDKTNIVDATRHRGMWMMRIDTNGDIYYVEPTDRFLKHERTNPRRKMVVYRHSDVILNGSHSDTHSSFCRVVDINQMVSKSQTSRGKRLFQDIGFHKSLKIHSHEKRHIDNVPEMNKHPIVDWPRDLDKPWEPVGSKRNTRAPPMDTTCDIYAIADHTAYSIMGENSSEGLSSFLIQKYKEANTIFRKHDFMHTGTTYGLKLRGLIIYTKPTTVPDGTFHFNGQSTPVAPKDIILSMTTLSFLEDYCLGHLTLARTFGGVLGMATIPSPNPSTWLNGICSSVGKSAHNVGFSSGINAHGTVLSSHLYLTTLVHELGHNFGSKHDPQYRSPCSPPSSKGGKFLMWPYMLTEGDVNHNTFSPCSMDSIKKVLKKKGHKCFMARKSVEQCGDGLVSSYEDCDSGLSSIADPCCTDQCRFSKGSVCSPAHHPCCDKSCQVAPPTQQCIKNVGKDCQAISNCSGDDYNTCPEPNSLPNGTPCKENGTCWYGNCISFCAALGQEGFEHNRSQPRQLVPCKCEENTTAMCLHCCRDETNLEGTCEIMGGPYGEGAPCLQGYCHRGICTTPVELSLEHVTEPIEEDSGFFIIVVVVVIGISMASIFVFGVKVQNIATRRRRLTQELELRAKLEQALGHLNNPRREHTDENTRSLYM